MFLCFVIEDQWDLDLVVFRHGQIVLDDELLPDLNDLLEEGLRVDELTRLLEELTHVEVAWTHVNAFRAILDTLLVDTLRKFLKSLLVSILSVLSHEQASECDI